MKRLALILAIVMTLGFCFTACTKSEPEETPGSEVVVDPVETVQPKIVLDYDTEKFVIDGVTLVKYIGDEEAVEIPDGTVTIGESAFRGNGTVKTVNIPDTVTAIGDSAFYKCEALTSIVIPDTVTSIGTGAFVDCTALENVTLGSGLTDIGSDLFTGCTVLKKVNAPENSEAAKQFSDKS